MTEFRLSSTAFADGEAIPRRHSGVGENLSPPLTWTGPPERTMSFALMVDDPDAPGGTFHHWGIYNIPGDARSLAEGTAGLFGAAVNDYGTRDYRGPRPPQGHGPHHYRFRLAALDAARLDLAPTIKVADLWRAIAPHRIAEAALTGTYER